MARRRGGLGAEILAGLAAAVAWAAPVVPDRGTTSSASAQQAQVASDADAPAREEPAVDYTGLSAVDPLARARAVAALGDARVLAQLAPRPDGGRPEPALALAAIRSAPWLADPALALPLLIAMMNGRDPDHAPAAAEATIEIARGLVERSRLPESVTPDKLAAWIKDLGAVELSARVRADIRLGAVQSAALLSAARERM